jgi:hypothetical protein
VVALLASLGSAAASRVQATAATDAPLAPQRVLLIGNSYTRFNVMPRLLARLSEEVPGARRLAVDAEARPGRTLRMHWRDGRALSLIRTGGYEQVVLQDHSLRPVDRPGEFAEYVARFTHEIQASSARVVLYGTWPRHPSARLYRQHASVRSFAQMAERVDSAYRSAAEQSAAALAPVGPAFERALLLHPQLSLYRNDATHPSVAGSFLAACVLYGTLAGVSPTHSSYVPYELAAADAELIKRIAAETLAAPPALPAPMLAAPETVTPAQP